MSVSDFISLLGGVALFLFGMSIMGDALKKVAGNQLELVLYNLTSTPIKGVLLGTGGLARAYTQGCKQAVAAAEILSMRPAVECTLTADYGFYSRLQSLLAAYGAVVRETDFAGEITLRFMLRAERLAPFAGALEEASAGGLAPTVAGECFYPFPEV